MQLQVHSILSSQVTHDEKTPCEEQQVKEQVWNMHYLQRQTFKEGVLT